MATPALNIPIRADISRFTADMEKTKNISSTALKAITKNVIDMNASFLATQGAAGGATLAFGRTLGALGPLSLAVGAIAGTFKLMAYATELAKERIEEFNKIADQAAKTGLGTELFQRITKAGEQARLSIDETTAALKRFNDASTPKLGGSVLTSRVGELTEAGNFKGNSGVAAVLGATDSEDRLRATVKLIDEAMQKGERLAALDLAEKVFGASVTEKLRQNSSYLREMLDTADKLKAKEIISTEDVGRAIDLKTRMEEAQKILADKWKPIQDDLAKLGMNYHESWVGITETMATAVGYANQLYDAIKSIPDRLAEAGNAPFWGKLTQWMEAQGLNSRPEGLILRGEPGFNSATDGQSAAGRALAAGLRNPAAVSQAMKQATDVSYAVRKDTSINPQTTKDLSDLNDQYDRAVATLEKHTARLNADRQAVGLGSGALEEYRAKAALMTAAQQAGIPITKQLTAEIEAQAKAAGNAGTALAYARAKQAADFDRATVFFSPTELRIAQEMQNIYGDKWQSQMQGAIAQQMRMTESIRDARDTALEFSKDLVHGLVSGQSAMQSLGNAATNLSAKLTDKALTSLFTGDLVGAAAAGLGAMQIGLFTSKARKRSVTAGNDNQKEERDDRDQRRPAKAA